MPQEQWGVLRGGTWKDSMQGAEGANVHPGAKGDVQLTRRILADDLIGHRCRRPSSIRPKMVKIASQLTLLQNS